MHEISYLPFFKVELNDNQKLNLYQGGLREELLNCRFQYCFNIVNIATGALVVFLELVIR